MANALLILCTCPDPETAERLAGGLVGARLAACVNVLPEIRSIYRWQEAVETDREALMVIKTTRGQYAEVERWIERAHPYDVPEVVALPAERVAGPYLEWLQASVAGAPEESTS